MTNEKALEVLREFQMWRRSEGKYEELCAKLPYPSKEIGIALDVAIKTLKKEAK